jgi:hypothetical protein
MWNEGGAFDEPAITPSPFSLTRGFCGLSSQQRHQYRPGRTLPCPAFGGKNAQIATSALALLTSLQNRKRRR